ncbi:hypothetical protein WR25_01031 isoform D [Diploscapter pachys]|uniref:RRM domain-containing protein n=1 Tax=Diploscapter pachys TaxID=2018661 RepID=A0A2A2JTA5_9BILA|nr:hypothetical protein WR25_01031 isoform D [Diploscapter pachys]
MSSFSTGDNPFIAAASIHSAPVISSNGFDLSALLPQFLSLQKIASSRELEKKEENSQPSQSLTQIVGPLYMRKLFIGGLSHETDDEDLRRYFARWGHVLDAIVIRDAATRHSRGFGFITYASQEFAEKCLACKPHTVKGKTVDSKRAVPRELIGKVEAQNCVDEDVTYQNNRKVLLTGKICRFYSFYFELKFSRPPESAHRFGPARVLHEFWAFESGKFKETLKM